MEFYTRLKEQNPVIVKDGEILYDNTIYVFDTEVTSVFYIDGKWQGFDYTKRPEYYSDIPKVGVLYLWGFSVDDKTYYGRTLEQFKELLEKISNRMIKKVIYVHNLSYDFQFLLNIIGDFEVFARKPHHPIYAYSKSLNIEFRCSYYLTNSNLAALAKFYDLPVQKLVGDLDYKLVRHSKTYISPKELAYLKNDLLCVYYYIKNVMFPLYNTIPNIPLTQTGRVRRQVKDLFIKDSKYLAKLKTLQPPNFKMFKMLRKAFAGGWTHANMFYADTVVENVYSYDRCSSYPSVMIMEKYPMTPFKEYHEDIDLINFTYTAALIDITFYDFQTTCCNTYLSFSKCIDFHSVELDNGRIISAKMIRFILTDVDYEIVKQCYSWSDKKVNECYTSQKEYLPQKYIEYACKLYEEKTSLKGRDEYKAQYQRSKEYINSLYGMTVTNTIQDECSLNGTEWVVTELTPEDIDELLAENREKKNVLSYAWGVWVTAYARRELWTIILEIDSSVVYCDTDSIKFVGDENIQAFKDYNKQYLHRLKTRGIDYNLLAPKDIKGIPHPLGVYEQERTSKQFKTLGAKKYCCDYGDELKITISGVPKGGVHQLNSIEDFSEGFVFGYNPDTGFIPSPKDEKVISFYIDNQQANGIIRLTDYNGLDGECKENFGICLMPTTYTLSMDTTYEDTLSIISAQLGGKPSALDDISLTDIGLIIRALADI